MIQRQVEVSIIRKTEHDTTLSSRRSVSRVSARSQSANTERGYLASAHLMVCRENSSPFTESNSGIFAVQCSVLDPNWTKAEPNTYTDQGFSPVSL